MNHFLSAWKVFGLKKEVRTTGESPPNQICSYGGGGEKDCGKEWEH